MPTFLDRVKFNVSGTPGTGNVTIGSAVSTFQTPAQAGGVTGDILPITFLDGTAWEESYCYFDSAAGTLTRTLLKSSTGSLLSLSSSAVGAVTNFARDAIGKGDGLVYIGQQVLGAAAASVMFSNIPADYEDLILVMSARGDNASTDVALWMRFNGDTGANYNDETLYAYNSTATQNNVGGTKMILPNFCAASAPSNMPGQATIEIANYARTTFNKTAFVTAAEVKANSAGNIVSYISSGSWASTAAINSVQLLPAAGNFVAGSVFTLYARAKSNGAGSNDPTLFLIHDQILASDSATYDVSNIPQTYEDLVIMVEARQNGSNAQIEFYIRPNNDTTSGNYVSYVENRFGTGSVTDKARWGCSEAGSATAGQYAPNEGTLFGYSKTNRFKHWLAKGFFTSGSFEDRNSGVWKNNAAVTSLRFFPASNSFVAGTRIRVYGRKPLLAPQANIANGNIRDALGAAWAKEMVVNGAAITAGVTRSVVATSGPFVAMKLVANTNVASGSKVIGSAKYTVPAGCKAFVMYAEFEDNERSNTGFYRARCYNSTQSRTAADAASGQVPSTSPGTTNWSNSYTGLLADPSGGGSGSVNAYYPTAGSAGDVLQMEAWTNGDGNYRIQHFTAYLVIVDAVTGDPRIA